MTADGGGKMADKVDTHWR